MPTASFRSFVGVAKDTINANVYSAMATGATSIPCKNIVGATGTLTTSGATYSAVIVDGYTTETVACSGNISGTTDSSTIACAATANPHSVNVYVYFQLTASIGPTAYIPVTKLDFSDEYVQLYDKGYRGSQADSYGAQQGTRSAKISLDGAVFPDSFGYILSSFFGAYDYTATAGIVPTYYAFSPQNTGSGQPSSYLFYDYNPAALNTRVYAKAVTSDLAIKFNPGALVEYTATIESFASGIVANPSPIPPTFSTFTPLPSRVGGTTIGGTATGKLESAEFAFKRQNFGPIFTLQGIQDPLALFSGPVALTVKTTLVVDDDTQLNNYIQQSQPSFTVTAYIGVGAAATDNGISIQVSKANYESVKLVQSGKAWIELDVPFTAMANATDATTAGAGLSPSKVTLHTKTTGSASLY